MVTIQLRRGTSAQWVAANPILANGEVGIELGPGIIPDKGKIGDGVTNWIGLPYSIDSVWIPLAEKGVAGGVATLDGTGVVPLSQIPGGAALDAEIDAAITAHEISETAHTGTYVALSGSDTKTGKFSLLPPNNLNEALNIQGAAGQTVPVAQIGGAVAIWSPTRNSSGMIDQDPYNNLRVNGALGANVLTIRNKNEDQFACSSIVFFDGSEDHSGEGRERFAIGYANNATNGPFGLCNYIETSNDPAIGSLTDAPTPLKIIQTGFLNGSYAARTRFHMDSAGLMTFNDADGVGQLQFPMLGPSVNVLTKLAVGKTAAAGAAVDIACVTTDGIRLTDTSLTRSTYITQETGFTRILADSNGIILTSDGAAGTVLIKSNKVTIGSNGSTTPATKLEVRAATADGISLVDTSVSRTTYFTQETGFTRLLAAGGNGILITSDGAAGTLMVKGNNVGIATDGSTAPTFRLDISGPTGQGIRIVDATLARTTYMTNESAAFNINNGLSIKLISGGATGFQVAGATVGLYGVTPVARAAAITAPTAPSAGYVQAEAAAMKTAVDAIRVALTNIGVTS